MRGPPDALAREIERILVPRRAKYVLNPASVEAANDTANRRRTK
jgi:hypothetical protein